MSASRAEEIIYKINMIRLKLDQEKINGILITEQTNFSYITAGGRSFLGLASIKACAVLLITHTDSCLISNNIEASRLIDEELPKGIFTLVEVPWEEDSTISQKARELAHDSLLTDVQLADYFLYLRITLLSEEQERYSFLCNETVAAVEQTVARLKPGITEHQVAGLVSSALWCRGIEPISLFVAADERCRRVRHYLPTNLPAEHQCIVSVCARKYGLVASITRTICFGCITDAVREAYTKLLEIESVFFQNLVSGNNAKTLFAAVCHAYEKNNLKDEWKNHHQGGVTGYSPRELRFTRQTDFTFASGQAFAFNPSCLLSKVEDTVLLTNNSLRILTTSMDWPHVEINGYQRPVIRILNK